jgi:hypothetical protein
LALLVTLARPMAGDEPPSFARGWRGMWDGV